jgi:transcriptional regulator with XRE-family HTH domain
MIKNSTTLINLLGQLLKELRAQKGWSQEEFAAISGISTRTLQRIEAGEKANMETLRAIAAALKMDVTTLLPLNALMQDEEFARMQVQLQEQAHKEAAQLEKELNVLPRVRNGKDLLSMVAGVEVLNTDHPHPISEEEGATIAALLAIIRDYRDIDRDLNLQHQMEIIFETSRCIEEVESFGLLVFAGRLRGSVVFPSPSSDVRPLRFRLGGVFICRASEIKTFKDPNNQDREAYRFRIPYGPVGF